MKIDALKLSPQEQREKRSTALRMREQGYTYKAIGEAVGVHPRTIAHWAQVAEHKGEKAAIAGGQRGVRKGDRRSLSRSEEHTFELQSLMRISYAVFCLKKKTQLYNRITHILIEQ